MVKFKGQAAIQYIAVVAFSFLILTPIVVYVNGANSQFQDELRSSYAKNLALQIRDAADLVAIQGVPARASIDLNVPDGINFINFSQSEIEVSYYTSAGTSAAYAYTLANLTGDLSSLSNGRGRHVLIVKAQASNTGAIFVNVTE